MINKIFISLFLFATSFVFTQTPPVTTDTQSEQPSSPALPTPEMPPLPSSAQITESYEGSFIRVLVSLLGLVLLIVGTFWILKKLGRGNFGKFGSDKSIRILERRPLSPKSVLYLIEVENKRVLIAESQLEVRSLTSFDAFEVEK